MGAQTAWQVATPRCVVLRPGCVRVCPTRGSCVARRLSAQPRDDDGGDGAGGLSELGTACAVADAADHHLRVGRRHVRQVHVRARALSGAVPGVVLAQRAAATRGRGRADRASLARGGATRFDARQAAATAGCRVACAGRARARYRGRLAGVPAPWAVAARAAGLRDERDPAPAVALVRGLAARAGQLAALSSRAWARAATSAWAASWASASWCTLRAACTCRGCLCSPGARRRGCSRWPRWCCSRSRSCRAAPSSCACLRSLGWGSHCACWAFSAGRSIRVCATCWRWW